MNCLQRNNVYPIFEERKDISPNPEACARTVLSDLFKLLEEYAPVWYTEEHHNQVSEVLNLRA